MTLLDKSCCTLLPKIETNIGDTAVDYIASLEWEGLGGFHGAKHLCGLQHFIYGAQPNLMEVQQTYGKFYGLRGRHGYRDLGQSSPLVQPSCQASYQGNPQALPIVVASSGDLPRHYPKILPISTVFCRTLSYVADDHLASAKLVQAVFFRRLLPTVSAQPIAMVLPRRTPSHS